MEKNRCVPYDPPYLFPAVAVKNPQEDLAILNIWSCNVTTSTLETTTRAWIYDVRMAQFVLKIEKLSHIMGPRASQDLRSPSPIMAPGQIWFFPTKFYFLTFISSKNKTKEDHSKRTWSKVETCIFIEDAYLLMNTIKIRHHFAYLRNCMRALYRFKDWRNWPANRLNNKQIDVSF